MQNHLQEQIHYLQLLKRRLEFFRAAEAELALRAIGGKYQPSPGGEVLADIVMDAYEFLVLRLWDFCEAWGKLGGLFSKLKADCTPLHRKSKRKSQEEDEHLLQISANAREKAFLRLFPCAARGRVGHADIEYLQNHFFDQLNDLKIARNKVHAHQLVERVRNPKFSRLTLSVAELDEIFQMLEQLLNDLGLLMYDTIYSVDCGKGDASDTIDLILHGSFGAICLKVGIDAYDREPYYWQRRAAYYAGSDWRDDQGKWKISQP